MTQKQEIILTGAGGQLGQTLQALWQGSELSAAFTLTPFTSSELDISDEQSIDAALHGRQAAAIINAAAYTAVDAAEDSANREQAYRVNETGPKLLANWAARHGARLLHTSTDFVFSGEQRTPYSESDATGPLGVYGASKLAGEQAVQAEHPDTSLIVRTSWLYSPFQNNFVKTMLRLMAERDELNIVDDQIGSPTSTFSLTQLLLNAVQTPDAVGIFHWCDGARISWFEFAVAIQEAGLGAGLLANKIRLNPIPTSGYPTPAKRPAYSVLDTGKAKHKLAMPEQDWQRNLRVVIDQIATQ